jgi:hypothetical protein
LWLQSPEEVVDRAVVDAKAGEGGECAYREVADDPDELVVAILPNSCDDPWPIHRAFGSAPARDRGEPSRRVTGI